VYFMEPFQVQVADDVESCVVRHLQMASLEWAS
jgi:hypothetical protein